MVRQASATPHSRRRRPVPDYQIFIREEELRQFTPQVQEAILRLVHQQEEARLAEQDRRHPGWKPGKDVVTAEEMREKASSQYNRDGTTIHLDLIDHA